MTHGDSTADVGATGGNDHGAERGLSTSRRALLATAGTAAAVGLAGCGILGDGDSGGDSPGGSNQTIESEVEGLEITDASSEVSQGTFRVTLTVENTGGEDTGILDYSYRLTLYDGDGAGLSFRGVSAANVDGFLDDDTGRVRLEPAELEGSPEDVARYDARIVCDGFADGVYCEG